MKTVQGTSVALSPHWAPYGSPRFATFCTNRILAPMAAASDKVALRAGYNHGDCAVSFELVSVNLTKGRERDPRTFAHCETMTGSNTK